MPSLGKSLSFCCKLKSDTESDVDNYRVVQLGRPNPTILRPSSAWKKGSSKSGHPSLTPSHKTTPKRTLRSFDEPESTPTKPRSNANRVVYPVQLRNRPHSLPLLSRTSEETEDDVEEKATYFVHVSTILKARPLSDAPVTYWRDYSRPQSLTATPNEVEVPSTPPIPPRNPRRLSKATPPVKVEAASTLSIPPSIPPRSSRRLSHGLLSANLSKMPNKQHSRELSTASTDTDESGGLGINFYDHLGNVTRVRERVKQAEVEPRSARASPKMVLEAQPSTNVTERSYEPEEPPLPLIEKLLEENYRAQAETFVRNSSRASVRSLASSNHSPAIGSNHSDSSPSTGPAASYTPTRKANKGESLASIQRSQSFQTPPSANKIVFEPFRVKSVSRSGSGFSPKVPSDLRDSTHSTYGHRVYSIPKSSPGIVKRRHRSSTQTRGPLYFTSQERQAIGEVVHEKSRSCDRHTDCTDCTNIEYAYFENKAMPTSIPPEERQRIINNNRSLRNVKNDLESLVEGGVISDDVYDKIMRSLPAESSLSISSRADAAPSPSPSAAPSSAFSNLNVNNGPPPPSYANHTPPSLPGRNQAPPKPEIARATALYRYSEPEDCNFEVGDQISVFEYMNSDWWLGKNTRTGKEGVFPVTYVQVQSKSSAPGGFDESAPGTYGGEKASGFGRGYPSQSQQQQGPPPPGPSNPYNSAAPPMQMANEPTDGKPGKGQEMGKKFGKKLGNAAIFGAGATIGGNIVNSIF